MRFHCLLYSLGPFRRLFKISHGAGSGIPMVQESHSHQGSSPHINIMGSYYADYIDLNLRPINGPKTRMCARSQSYGGWSTVTNHGSERGLIFILCWQGLTNKMPSRYAFCVRIKFFSASHNRLLLQLFTDPELYDAELCTIK